MAHDLVEREPHERCRTPRASSASTTSSDKYSAWYMAKRFVKDYLKSPSTADFGGGGFSSDYQDPKKCVQIKSDGTYVVSGWVDSQNGFGATVRTRFRVNLRDKGDGNWSLINVPIMVQR